MTTAPRPKSTFFLWMAVGFLVVAVTGFSTTLFIPLARGTFSAPVVIRVHGALLFAWLGLFLVQSLLVQRRQVAVHRRLGWFGAALAAAIVLIGIPVSLFVTHRDLASGGGNVALGQFVNLLIEMLLFGSLVLAAILSRRDRETHKRLLLLTNISILGPAWLRFRHFMPQVPNPLVTFSLVADAVLLIAIAHDLISRRRVHNTYLFAGGAMVATHMAELFASETPLWLATARFLLGSHQ